ncbi:orotate phosphoribosyltransferase [Variibacter gotjawalensis]|uniref:Orotate phosphoribosyltransferase n=1 Tax=Variibacter gotjawalensis TaxID=1333996 RepID=A0A0S3PTD6_9BRAD|nr:orotate phosphoribosyltransferase [Variibacter gotjawalensis]NIK49455.1 orotate phosphoribosyltransferase [Variibacter gotjawalensis]RZS51307.1 orotate phosphoribosyltransferase [Variibacter gotjawalensis]BAT59140.1 orotate phosphoribosyltransferase [Variibacter gotjawalensis]
MQPLRRAEPAHANAREGLIALIKERSFGRGKITLASGRESDFYFDLRPTALHPAGAAYIGELVVDMIKDLDIEYVGGLAMGAIPIATAVAIASYQRGGNIGAFFVRKAEKNYGTRKLVEGLPKGQTLKGKNVLVVEDTTTSGGSAMQAVQVLREEGANVVLVITIVDRQEGAEETFAAEKLPFRSVLTADVFLKD